MNILNKTRSSTLFSLSLIIPIHIALSLPRVEDRLQKESFHLVSISITFWQYLEFGLPEIYRDRSQREDNKLFLVMRRAGMD